MDRYLGGLRTNVGVVSGEEELIQGMCGVKRIAVGGI